MPRFATFLARQQQRVTTAGLVHQSRLALHSFTVTNGLHTVDASSRAFSTAPTIENTRHQIIALTVSRAIRQNLSLYIYQDPIFAKVMVQTIHHKWGGERRKHEIIARLLYPGLIPKKCGRILHKTNGTMKTLNAHNCYGLT